MSLMNGTLGCDDERHVWYTKERCSSIQVSSMINSMRKDGYVSDSHACSGVSTGGDRGTCPPDFRPGDSHAKVPPPTFLTHNDAIAGFTSQSLSLPAYACRSDSSSAIKLAPRMHQYLSF